MLTSPGAVRRPTIRVLLQHHTASHVASQNFHKFSEIPTISFSRESTLKDSSAKSGQNKAICSTILVIML